MGAFWLAGCMPSDRAVDTNEVQAVLEDSQSGKSNASDPLLVSSTYGESPVLAKEVAAGRLPSVSERLPDNPLVIRPIDEIGRYGGTLRRALTDDTINATGVSKTLNEGLMGYSRPIADSIELNLAESYTFSPDGKSAVFKIRSGIKWSDGAPFTVDDILFWYYDMQFDENARAEPLPPSELMIDGKPLVLEKIDDTTLRVSASKPMGRLLDALCRADVAYPKHFLSQYHPRYNASASYEDFRSRITEAGRVFVPGIPRISAWVPVERIRSRRVIYQRNPYYWKVDTAGNQLPYIDAVTFEIVADPQVILLKLINSEIDLFGRHSLLSMTDVLPGSANRGVYRVRIDGPGPGDALYLNWDCPRKYLREAIRDKSVRIALSHAINRHELQELAYSGLLNPGGYSLHEGSPYYSRDAYLRYIEYDPEFAKRLLEEAGFTDSDHDGFRELSDGTRFDMTIDTNFGSGRADACELIAGYWEAVGIKTHLSVSPEQNTYQRRISGAFEILMSAFLLPVDPGNSPHRWVITDQISPFWHRNASSEGPEWLRESTRQLETAMSTIDPDVKRAAMKRFRDLQTENIPVIALGALRRTWGFNLRLGNVPEKTTQQNHVRAWSRPIFHEQLYIRADAR